MTEHELFSLGAVARALGIPPRRVRSWADSGALDVLQPARGAERLVPAAEVRRLQSVGYRIRWELLSDPAHPADQADASDSVPDALDDVA